MAGRHFSHSLVAFHLHSVTMRPAAKKKTVRRKKEVSSPCSRKEEYNLYLSVLLNEKSSSIAQAAAVNYFRRLFTENMEPPTYFTDDLIDLLLAIMSDEFRTSDVRTEACWVITNMLCSKKNPLTHVIMGKGTLSILVEGVTSESLKYREQCIWAIGNIAADCRECKESVRETGVLSDIAQYVHQLAYSSHSSFDSLKSSVWCTLNILRNGGVDLRPPTARMLFAGLTRHLRKEETPLTQDVIFCLAFLVDDRNYQGNTLDWHDMIDVFLDDVSLLDSIIAFLRPGSILASPTLRLLGNIITGTDDQTTKLISRAHFLSLLTECLQFPDPTVQRESAWILSNIAAGPPMHIDMITKDSWTLTALLECLNSPDYKLVKECSWVIVNILSGLHASRDDVEEVLGYGVLCVIRFLASRNADVRLINRAIVVLTPILEHHPEWAHGMTKWVSSPLCGRTAGPLSIFQLLPKTEQETRPMTYVLADSDAMLH